MITIRVPNDFAINAAVMKELFYNCGTDVKVVQDCNELSVSGSPNDQVIERLLNDLTVEGDRQTIKLKRCVVCASKVLAAEVMLNSSIYENFFTKYSHWPLVENFRR